MQLDSKNKKVLYVTTHVTSTWRYFSWCSYPSIWYCRIQNKILTILNNHKNIEAFVGFYPNDICINPNIEFAKTICSNLRVQKNSLIDVLENNNFDLIITEAVATSLLEILCTKSQILVFAPTDYIKINREDKKLLEKRVFLAENEEEYFKILNNILISSNPHKSKDINDEFLFKYGIGDPYLDPLTLSRKALQSIISKSKKNDKIIQH